MHEQGTFEAACDALIQFGQAALRERLVASSCGNVSVRLDADRFVISASGAEVGCLALDTLSIVSLREGTRLAGPKPSVEAELHRQVYCSRASISAVLHCQSPAATLFACDANAPINLDFFPEMPAYVRKFAGVPYAPPGSPELAKSVTDALIDPDVTIVQLRNHGQIVIGSTWQTTMRRGTCFETACWMALQGRTLQTIPEGEAARLRSSARDV